MNTFSDSYLRSFEWLMAIEGFYSNHPRDRGGETAWGISRNHWPQYWSGGPPSREEALNFYWTNFWLPCRCPSILNEMIARELFEGAVLSGSHRAVTWLQMAVNVIRFKGTEGLVVDGKIGPKTLTATNWYAQRYPAALFNAQNLFQGAFLISLGDPDFTRGWLGKRIQAIQG